MSEEYNEDVQPQETEQEETPDFQEEEGEDTPGEGEETTDYKALYEDLLPKYEQTKKDKNGLLNKVSKVTKKSQPTSGISDERLDKLELRQIDSNLTADQIQDILVIKKAKGLDDVTEAYQNPMVQSFLKDFRATQEKKDKVNKATPKAQGGSAVSSGGAKRLPSQNKDWLNKLPGKGDDAVVNELQERFFAN